MYCTWCLVGMASLVSEILILFCSFELWTIVHGLKGDMVHCGSAHKFM